LRELKDVRADVDLLVFTAERWRKEKPPVHLLIKS